MLINVGGSIVFDLTDQVYLNWKILVGRSNLLVIPVYLRILYGGAANFSKSWAHETVFKIHIDSW